MTGETRAAAHGRWREILPALGIPPKHLVNTHGPCPLCCGRDRFRFDDRYGHGDYFCNQCGPGDGIAMLRKFHNWSYAEACRNIDRVIGRLPQRPRKTSVSLQNKTDRAMCLGRLRSVLDGATRPSIVEDYLLGRGVSVVPSILLGHHQLPYYDDDRNFAGYRPAMIAPVLDEEGELRNLHRTYVTEPRCKKIAVKMMGFRSLAVRLFEHDDVLGVAEGIETAIAAHQLFGIPTWAVINTTNMAAWRPPEGVRVLHIFADNDSLKDFAGQTAAFNLARSLRRECQRDIEVEVHIPPTPGTDWLDVLNERA